MPKNWALTPEGHETDEPAEAMDGPLLPIGEYKGYGLSFVTDVLTGVLSGAAYGTVPYSDRNFLDVGHQFIAYHIDWFMAREVFYRRMADFIGMVRASRTRPGFDEILLPGEPEWRRSQDKKRNGVPLEQSVYEDLRALSEELGVAWPFE
jgi:LDH2 family malate/lactate/ureidoglycolate dehydrogenase